MPQFFNAASVFFISILLLFFSSCNSKKKELTRAKAAAPVMVDVLIASPAPVNNVIEVNGTVIANEFTEIRPEVSGRLTYLNMPEGNPVAQGTVLAKINAADLAAQLEKSKVQLHLAQKTADRYRKLLDVNGINESDWDAAENQVNSLKADMAYTQALIDKTIIKAPFNGVLGLRQVSPGAYVSTATVLTTIQQINQVKIDFTLPEKYSSIIKKGMVVTVETDADGGRRGSARIVATEPGANRDTRNLLVRAELLGTQSNPGGFVKVFIDEGKTRSSIMVPANAIIPDDKNNQLVVVKGGKANFVAVRTGLRESDMIEILEGIHTGDSVVVSGVLFVRPQALVNVRAAKTAAQWATGQLPDTVVNK